MKRFISSLKESDLSYIIHGNKTVTQGWITFKQNRLKTYIESLKTINWSIEVIFTEMNIRSKKWFICFTYNPSKSLLEHDLIQIQTQLDTFSKNYEHLLIMGDFNANVFESTLTSFCTLFKLKILSKNQLVTRIQIILALEAATRSVL